MARPASRHGPWEAWALAGAGIVLVLAWGLFGFQGVVWDAEVMAVRLARASPGDLAPVLISFLEEIESGSLASAMDELSRDPSPEVRAMVGWLLPAFWQFRVVGSSAEERWARGMGHRLVGDQDPRVTASAASHLVATSDFSVIRALLQRAHRDASIERPPVGFLSWGGSRLSSSVEATVRAHLMYKLERLDRDAGVPSASELEAMVERLGRVGALTVDGTRWLQVFDVTLVLRKGERRRLRQVPPSLDLELGSFGVGTERLTPNVSAELVVMSEDHAVHECGLVDQSLGTSSFTTGSSDGPTISEAGGGGQMWKSRVMAIPAEDGRLRIRIVGWVNRRS